jgi:hypothetical protein
MEGKMLTNVVFRIRHASIPEKYVWHLREQVMAKERRSWPMVTLFRIKCASCEKLRMQYAFSKTQLDKVRQHVTSRAYLRHELPQWPYVRCIDCSGMSRVELKCTACGKLKGIDEFSKSQRGKGDLAVSSDQKQKGNFRFDVERMLSEERI